MVKLSIGLKKLSILKKEFEKKIKEFLKMKNGLVIDENGNKCWYKNDKFHREGDLPAIEYVNGSKEWYQNGKLHRENDLPAAEYASGNKYWYTKGKYNRLNGPAIIYKNGRVEYWIKGVKYSKEEFEDKIKKFVK